MRDKINFHLKKPPLHFIPPQLEKKDGNLIFYFSLCKNKDNFSSFFETGRERLRAYKRLI